MSDVDIVHDVGGKTGGGCSGNSEGDMHLVMSKFSLNIWAYEYRDKS